MPKVKSETKTKSLGLGGLGNAASKIKNLQSKSSAPTVISTGDSLFEIDLDLLDYDIDQYRQDKEEYDLQGLADSIYELGLLEVPNVEPGKKGRFVLTDGEMRTRAFHLNRERYPDDVRFKRIPVLCRTIKALKGLDLRQTKDVIQLTSNLLSDPGSIFDVADKLSSLESSLGAKAVKQLMADKGQKHGKVDMSRWRAVARTPIEIRDQIKANEIKDKETIGLLAKIYGKDQGSFKTVLNDHHQKKLKKSLNQSLKDVWSKLKEDKPSVDVKVVTKVEEKPTVKSNPTSSIEADNSMRLDAINIEHVGNELIIEVSQGQVFRIGVPESCIISINKKG